MNYSELNIHKQAQKLLKRTGHHRGLTSLFGVCKTWLVLYIKYNKNIQTLIFKSDFSMWQHDLKIHDGITTRPL